MRKVRFNRVYELILSCKGKKIIRYTTYAVAIVLAFSSCKSENQAQHPQDAATYSARVVYNDTTIDFTPAMQNVAYGVMSDTNPIQIATCEKLLDECVEAGILDRKGVKVYRKIAKHPSVARYMELIEECENENTFYDTVGEGDAWCDYCDYVLTPRGECCED